MQTVDIAQAEDYRRFITAWLDAQPRRGYGMRSRLAEAMGCRLSYLSRVMEGAAELSPEQALRGASFFGLTRAENKLFRLLVDLERGGTPDLRAAIREEIEE